MDLITLFRKGFLLCTQKALLFCNPFNKIIAANIYISWNELLPNQWYVELNKLTLESSEYAMT